ncbi:hypothetical protein [Janthinobacterium sp. NKUCC06_STL]|uniref:hypothetical protein n=1 Tax=Janthinobacterium sp. NKUCC06_STL TaxID=2842127 RepID=UPI0027DA3309|nr:hypothetical protein [Janthinobacterium sp. NKUCC06_STL]
MSQPTDSQPQASSPHAMPGGFTQTTRLLRLTTPLGPDKLLLECLRGEEGLSQSYAFQVTALSNDARIPLKSLIG